jgi:hypothetical protein
MTYYAHQLDPTALHLLRKIDDRHDGRALFEEVGNGVRVLCHGNDVVRLSDTYWGRVARTSQ